MNTSTTLIQNQPGWWQRSYTALSLILTNMPSAGAYLEPLIQPLAPMWSTAHQRTRVTEVRHENEEIITLQLQPGKRWKGFTPGQYVNLYIEHNGRRSSRCFSISSAPALFEQHGLIELSIRIQEQGRITPLLPQLLYPGAWVGLSQAMGDFVLKDTAKPMLFIAGGSGITPFRSFMGFLSAQQRDADAVLLYYARGKQGHIFTQEWQALSDAHPSLKIQLIDTAKQKRLSARQLKKLCPDYAERLAYICGPSAMIEHTQNLLNEQGIESDNIFSERFGPAPVTDTKVQTESQVHFINSQQAVTTDKQDNSNLLDLAEAQGLTPSSGCRMGICHTCKCRKKSGVVYNALTDSYSDSGEEDIQLCVSVPVGEVQLEL